MKILSGLFIASLLLLNSVAFASFEENARRYLSGQEIIWSLSAFFDFSKNVRTQGICSTITEQNSSYTGSNSPAIGEPISPSPSQSTVLWITGCIEDYLSSPLLITKDADRFRNLVGAETVALLGPMPVVSLSQDWSLWPEDQKKTLIRYMVKAFLGSDDVIKDFGFIQNPDDFRAQILTAADSRPQASVFNIVTLLAVNLAVRDEFLSY